MDSSPSSKRFSVSPVAGVKRPAPSLLPAFEPLSSSPSLPRPTKRLTRVSLSQHDMENNKYPTPIPTSSTGIIPSSPPQFPTTRRSGLARTLSTFSERAPLSAVPSIELDRHGVPTLMGRSSNSSHYQLSTNKLISRVHVRALYVIASPPASSKIQVECVGWNGARVHCQGKAWLLRKGDSFTSENVDVDVLVDVQDARVLVRWPRQGNKITTPADSDSPWSDENSPRSVCPGTHRSPYQSPLRQRTLQSPISPSPAVQAVFASSSTLLASDPPLPPPIHVYEDERSEDEAEEVIEKSEETQSTQRMSQPLEANTLALPSEFSDADEENDPVVHSFGPFGSDLLPRMEAFTSNSPRRRPLKPKNDPSISPSKHQTSSESTDEEIIDSLINHVINQLAFSRLSSTPLSTLMDHLPSPLMVGGPSSKDNKCLSMESLKNILDATKCIGKVEREGKDAAGKKLETEYYYIADLDDDLSRKDAVVEGLRKPGLRACRKQHKQYFWRKPK